MAGPALVTSVKGDVLEATKEYRLEVLEDRHTPVMQIHPFRVQIDDQELEDMRWRLRRTRWPDEVAEAGWRYGVPQAWLRELCEYWADGFDWRRVEAQLNSWPQFRADLDGIPVHFVHEQGQGPSPMPLVLTIGWPSTFAEVLPVIGPLTDPAHFGADPADAFHLVVPTIPGFGFSSPYVGGGTLRVEDLWARLMADLGYNRFAAAGSDWGANVTNQLGRFHVDRVIGLHFSSPDLELPNPLPTDLSAEERSYIAHRDAWEHTEGAYAAMHRTKPQTLAYSLSDSPAGLAAWILEKFHAWSGSDTAFSRDDLLTAATIYWTTNTLNSSARTYYEAERSGALRLRAGERVQPPIGVVTFPHGAEPNMPRQLAGRSYQINRWTDMSHGGHFPAFETPEVLVHELREFFRPLRSL